MLSAENTVLYWKVIVQNRPSFWVVVFFKETVVTGAL